MECQARTHRFECQRGDRQVSSQARVTAVRRAWWGATEARLLRGDQSEGERARKVAFEALYPIEAATDPVENTATLSDSPERGRNKKKIMLDFIMHFFQFCHSLNITLIE